MPLKVKLSSKQALSEELPETIDLTIKGKGWELITIFLGKSVSYNLDLTNYKRDIKISSWQAVNDVLNLPSGISVVNIFPDTLAISFDNISEKYVKVRNNISVVPKSGYMLLGSATISPDSLKITGANSIISKIKFLQTETKVFDNISGKFSKQVNIRDTLSNIIKIEAKTVTISCIVDLAAEKDFEDVSLKIKNIPDDKEVLLIPPKIFITLRGGVDELSKLTSENINSFIEYKSLENDSTGFVTPLFDLPENISILKYEPKQFKYIIKKK